MHLQVQERNVSEYASAALASLANMLYDQTLANTFKWTILVPEVDGAQHGLALLIVIAMNINNTCQLQQP
jgi:hypothetical protein